MRSVLSTSWCILIFVLFTVALSMLLHIPGKQHSTSQVFKEPSKFTDVKKLQPGFMAIA